MSKSIAKIAYFNCISIVLIIALLVYTAIRIRSINRMVSTSSQENVEMASFVFAAMIESSVKYDGLQICQQTFLNFLCNNRLEDEPVLVIRYSSLTCRSCMIYISDIISDVIPDALNHNRVIYVESECTNNLEKFGTTLFLPQGETFEWELEETREPLIFVYDKFVKHLFVADVQYPRLLDSYLTVVKEKYSF